MKQQSERLGQEPIPKLLLSLAVPAMMGTFVMALYNVVDTLFVAKATGTTGVAAIAIAFPVQMLIMAVAGMIGIGGASVISRMLGAGKSDRANQVFGQVIGLVLTVSLIGLLLGLGFLRPLLYLFGSSETILPLAEDFLGIILYGTVFFTFAFAMNNIIRSEGNAKTAMWTMIISAGLNIILNPIFIFGFGMGVKGSALATVLAQGVTALYLVYYFLSGKSSLTFKVSYLRPNLSLIKEILTVGSSAFIQQGAGSIMFIIANHMLIAYGGDLAVGVFGIIHRIIMFSIMPIMGIVQGLLPLVGYNFGANLPKRVNESISLAIKAATIIAALASILMIIFAKQLLSIFTTEPEVLVMGQNAMKIMFILYTTVGLQMVSGGVFQALGKARPAIILSLARQVLFLIPLMLILPVTFGLNGIWMAFPAADLLSLLLTLWFIRKYKSIFFSDVKSLPLKSLEN